MAFAATGAPITADTGLLFLANLIWVIAYDTCYAMVDRDDDLPLAFVRRPYSLVIWTAPSSGYCKRLYPRAIDRARRMNLQEFAWPYYLALRRDQRAFCLSSRWLMKARERGGCFAAFLNNQWKSKVWCCSLAFLASIE